MTKQGRKTKETMQTRYHSKGRQRQLLIVIWNNIILKTSFEGKPMEYLQNWKVSVPKTEAITAKGRKWEQLVWACQVKQTQGGRSRISNQDLSFLQEKKGAVGSFWPEKEHGSSWWPSGSSLLNPLAALGKLGKFSTKVDKKRDVLYALASSSYLLSVLQI